jgi:hypothetical protein
MPWIPIIPANNSVKSTAASFASFNENPRESSQRPGETILPENHKLPTRSLPKKFAVSVRQSEVGVASIFSFAR